MPGRDGTGPAGKGPGTGKGKGPCGGNRAGKGRTAGGRNPGGMGRGVGGGRGAGGGGGAGRRGVGGGGSVAGGNREMEAGAERFDDPSPGECVCPECGTSIPHRWGMPCSGEKCPECNAPMVKKL